MKWRDMNLSQRKLVGMYFLLVAGLSLPLLFFMVIK
jgi:hypothetical protein